jgi:hypothetical protein
VQAYDRDDLVHWIDLAPSVGAWLAEKLGKRPPGIRDLDCVWNEWVPRHGEAAHGGAGAV